MAATKTKKKKAVAKKKTTAPKTKKSPVNVNSVKKGTAKLNKSVKKVNGLFDKMGERKLGKTYLTDKELKYFKELIIEQKNEILENARRLRESLIDESTGDYVGDNSTFSMHMAEQGTDEMEREKAYMFIQRDEKHLFYLESALVRIAKKTYGLCTSCGRPINKARLEAVPITSHCINCKQSLSS
jgi:RNA polymerase-binding protein DksA